MYIQILSVIVIFMINLKVIQSFRYENFTLFGIVPTEEDHLRFLQNLDKQKYLDMKFWQKPHKLFYDVQLVVNPLDRDLFLERAKHFNMQVDVLIPDIQKAFDEQSVRDYHHSYAKESRWEHYHSLEDIYHWLVDLANKFPKVTELNSLGKTAQGRDIYILSIKRPGAKYKAVVEGGIHGNEWVAIEFVTYLTYQLLHVNMTVDSHLRRISMSYNWYLIPVLNPDGFEFTRNGDRLWKKNKRSVNGSFGVNLNRNFGYNFGTFDSSTDPKDENYAGPVPFSEPETQALMRFLHNNKDNLKFYFSFHSYGQKIILPFSDRINHFGDFVEMENYGKQAIIEMFHYSGVKYSIGTYYDTFGTRISGNSASWVKKYHKVKYVYTFYLRDNGSFGYALPSDQILITCNETLIGLAELMSAKLKYLRTDLFSSSGPAGWNVSNLLIFVVFFVGK